MHSHFRFHALVHLGGGLGMLWSSLAQASVNLEWRPVLQQDVEVGETVEIGLYAVSDDETDQLMSSVEAILLWDPTRLGLLGLDNNGPYEWLASSFPDDSGPAFDGLNFPFSGLPANDGNAWYNAWSKLPPAPAAAATPDGLLLATFQFQALRTGIARLELPPEFGEFTHTRVQDADAGGKFITGTLGPPATVLIGASVPAVSEWGLVSMGLLLLAVGTIVLGRRGQESLARATGGRSAVTGISGGV